MIDPQTLAAGLDELDRIGVSQDGVNRLAWTDEDAALGEWFAARADRAGLVVERDPAGNRWAVPKTSGPWWAVGSHLDSVRCGGRYDGPLGVVAAFAVAERCSRPVAVLCLADEEGARFNTPTFGSRALVGRLDIEDALARVDADGVRLADAMRAAGVDPERLPEAPRWLDRLAGFLELHIDQSRALYDAGVAAAPVSALAARLRLEAELRGRADHAGTTPYEERADALLAAARLIIEANRAGATLDGVVSTATRIEVEPNALTAVPGRVRLWLDARGPSTQALHAFETAVRQATKALAPVTSQVRIAARSDGHPFDADVLAALRRAAPESAPTPVCYAGHDAGILGERVPTGMVLVRNPTGISHSPDEHVQLEDAAIGATVLLKALEELA